MNKVILGITAASAMLVTGIANAIVIVGIDDNSATNIVSLGDFAGNTIVSDGDAADIDPNVNGVATIYMTDVFAFTINAGWLESDPTRLHIGAILAGVDEVTFAITATDLTVGSSWVFDIGGSVFGDVTATAFIDNTNTAFGIGTEIGSYTGTDLTGAFSYTSDQLLHDAADPFSLTIYATINGSGSADADISVPEPSMIALLSLGLVGLGIAGRRKKA